MLQAAIKEVRLNVRKLKHEPIVAVFIGLVTILTGYFVLWPVIKVISEPSLSQYSELFLNARWSRAALNSLMMMLLSTISCTLVAFVFAYALARLDIPFKGLFRFITLLPIVSPPFIVALSYILLFGRQGIISKHVLGITIDVYGWHGLWLVQTINFFPFAFVVIYGVLCSNSTNLEYAAYNLGATRWQVFKDVFLPLCRPGIAGGALIAAMNILADFGNPMIIGGSFSLLPTEAYLQMSGWFNLPAAAMLATTLLVPAFTLFWLNKKWVGKRSYVVVTGKESSLAPYPLPKWVKWGIFSFCMLVTITVLAVYGVLFYGAFAKTWGYDWSLTLDNLKYVFNKKQEVINSLKFSLLAAVGASTLAVLLAYIVQRKPMGFNKVIDFLAILPGAVPGIFLSLGFAMSFNSGPLTLTGTSAIIVLALLFWNLPTCYSANSAALQQIGHSLEEAATNLGSNSFTTFRKILLPLLKGPFLSSMALAFLRSMTCLSVVIFIYAASTSVGTISILGLVSNGEWGSASAFTIVLITIAFSVLGIANLILRRQGKSLEL